MVHVTPLWSVSLHRGPCHSMIHVTPLSEAFALISLSEAGFCLHKYRATSFLSLTQPPCANVLTISQLVSPHAIGMLGSGLVGKALSGQLGISAQAGLLNYGGWVQGRTTWGYRMVEQWQWA